MLTAIPHKSREEICEIRGRPVWGRTEIKGPTISRFPSFRWKPFPEFHHFRPMCLSHANHRLFFRNNHHHDRFFKTCLSRKGPQQMPLAIASVNLVIRACGFDSIWPICSALNVQCSMSDGHSANWEMVNQLSCSYVWTTVEKSPMVSFLPIFET